MLGNGWCARPAELDCSFQTVCESCGFFAPTVEFKGRLEAQADHAAAQGDEAGAETYRKAAGRAEAVGR